MLAWEEGWESGLKARKDLISPVGAWFSQLGQLNQVHQMYQFPYNLFKKVSSNPQRFEGKSLGD